MLLAAVRGLVPPALVAARRHAIRARQVRRPFAAIEPFSQAYLEKRDYVLAQIGRRVQTSGGLEGLGVLGEPDLARVDERAVEYAWALSRLRAAQGVRLLDVGCVLNQPFYAPLLRSWFDERWYLNITYEPLNDEGSASMVAHDIRDCPLPDGWFSAITCLSTLEHVGMDNTIYTQGAIAAPAAGTDLVARAEPAVREMLRLLAPGGTLLMTVPFGRAEDRGWFQVFGPEGIERLRSLGDGASVEVFRVSEQGWSASTPEDARDVVYGEGAVASAAVACLAVEKPS
jgi:SAM-dependent methyltransferase